MKHRKLLLAIIVLALCSSLVAQFTPRPASDVEQRVNSLISQMTLEEKIDYIGGVNDFYIRAIPRLHIPALRMSDGPLGVHDYGPTTAYPAGIALAASFDADLAHRVGASMGQDARARGVNFILAPGMNIYRAPMCGRNFEYFGEDPYLASRMAVNIIEGIQSQRVLATAKHYAANNQEFNRHNLSSDVDERTLREIYLPAFEASVREAKVGAVMNSYNLINGIHATQNGHLNLDILRHDWGFDGILMSDWDSTYDGIAAANNGLDLEMPTGKFMSKETLIPAIKEGKVSEATIDEKVRHILTKALEYSFFDQPQTDPSIPVYSQEGRELALQEAREGMVLLKNDRNLLPLDKTRLKTIAVLGPEAYPADVGGGGSSLVKPFNSVSFLEGISNYLGTGVKVLYSDSTPPLEEMFDRSAFVVTPGGEAGLKGEYFDNQELEGTPMLTRVDPFVHFVWGGGSYSATGPVDHFSARWTGYFVPPATDDYKFYTNSDDGVRLYIDDQRVIDDWHTHAETVNSYGTHLEGGRAYKIRLEYFEGTGDASVGFGVIGAEQAIGKDMIEMAAKADAVVLCVGFDPATEGEEQDRTFQLPAGQDQLIRKIAAVNKNVIVVLSGGGSADTTRWLDDIPAFLHVWYSGQEGGTALAQILFGDYSPSGKLPISFERRWEDNPTHNSYYPSPPDAKGVKYSEGIFVGYRGYDKSGVKPLFPFGFGLSYTTFAYKNISVSPAQGDLSQPVKVSFDVTNTGKRAGAEVAELYVGEPHAKIPRPVKELKGFSRVELRPGETHHVTLSMNRRAFSYYDVDKKDWTADPGKFDILVGSSSEKIQLQGAFTLER
jgi:beta-glucosidase